MILRSRHFRHWMARLALAAILLVSLMPTVSRWLESGAQRLPDMVLAMCTSDGMAFTKPSLLADSETSLIFLDDATVVSRRAESLTLAALGRFSASLAHEIRNPLAAINYAVQLLEESQQITDGDRRLLQIIHQQCQRTNGIVESVLGLARRERATPEHVDLNSFVRRFVDEYQQTLSIETDTLEPIIGARPVPALVDPRHLQQVVTVLVQNALTHGRLPSAAADVTVIVEKTPLGEPPQLVVRDRGPGVNGKALEHLFTPFFTTAEHGTGLGLYIARQLCEANQCTLRYDPPSGGGGAFRISLPAIKVLRSSSLHSGS